MSCKGKLIEYVEHGRFICAMVVEDTGKRLRLLNQNGREVALPPARVVHMAEGSCPATWSREEMLRELKTVAEKRQELKDAIDLKGVWELASEEPGLSFTPRFLAELSLGETASDDHEAAFLRAVFDDPLYFRYRLGKVQVHASEVVEQHLARLEKERQKQAFMKNSVGALQRIMAGETVAEAEWPERAQCLEMLADFYLQDSEAADRETARQLVKLAGLTRPHDIFHLLVRAGVWDRNENIPLLRQGLPVAFAAELEEQAASLKLPAVEELLKAGRRDLRELELLTIDGETTRDFDDALHIERRGDNFLVGIHITDVSWAVKPGSALFDEARKRLTSIYFAEGQIPMLPRVLSEDRCSLIAGEDRPALSFMVKLTPAGEVLESSIVRSVVRVQRQLSYLQAETMLDSDEPLALLRGLSRRLLERRIEAGAILLPIPDVSIKVSDGEVKGVELLDVDTPTRTLVAEFMVLANMVAADYLANQQVPGLFRCQGPPGQRLYHGMDKDLFLNYRQRKHLSPAQLLTTPQRHSCVGTEQYTTITSPVRRFLDLLMQQQICGLLQGKGAVFSNSELRGLAAEMVSGQGRINLVKRQRHRYWLLRYLEQKSGQRLDALILEKGPRRVFVVLLDVLLEGDLPPSQAVESKPGEVVRVKIGRVSPLDDLLRLEW